MSSTTVWDQPTRWFHWINALLVAILLLSGFLFTYRSVVRIEGAEAKMALMAAHAWVGVAFAFNLAVRVVWGFIGNASARWPRVLPDAEAVKAIPEELRGLRMRRPVRHVVRSPVSRLSATIMFVILLTLGVTGLIRSATDLYQLPFGPVVAAYVAEPGVRWSEISWRSQREFGDASRLARVKQIKAVAGPVHKYGAWVILVLALAHVSGVALTEVRQRSGLISTMVSGVARGHGDLGDPGGGA